MINSVLTDRLNIFLQNLKTEPDILFHLYLSLKIPTDCSFYDIVFNSKLFTWQKWDSNLSPAEIDCRNLGIYHKVFETKNVVRSNFFMGLYFKNNQNTLYTGLTGVGKTITASASINNIARKMKCDTLFQCKSIPGTSFRTKLHDSFLKMEPNGLKKVIFIDDINSLTDVKSNVQYNLECFRMLLEQKQFYSGHGHFLNVPNFISVCTMTYDDKLSQNIFEKIGKSFMQICIDDDEGMIGEISHNLFISAENDLSQHLGSEIFHDTLIIYRNIKKKYLTTPNQIRYLFSIGDILKIIRILIINPQKKQEQPVEIVKTWVNACYRVFEDKIKGIDSETDKLIQEKYPHFNISSKNCEVDEKISNLIDSMKTKYYFEDLWPLISYQALISASHVLFDLTTLQHNILITGQDGNCAKSIANLATLAAGYKFYTFKNWDNFLIDCYTQIFNGNTTVAVFCPLEYLLSSQLEDILSICTNGLPLNVKNILQKDSKLEGKLKQLKNDAEIHHLKSNFRFIFSAYDIENENVQSSLSRMSSLSPTLSSITIDYHHEDSFYHSLKNLILDNDFYEENLQLEKVANFVISAMRDLTAEVNKSQVDLRLPVCTNQSIFTFLSVFSDLVFSSFSFMKKKKEALKLSLKKIDEFNSAFNDANKIYLDADQKLEESNKTIVQTLKDLDLERQTMEEMIRDVKLERNQMDKVKDEVNIIKFIIDFYY